ncbi:30S ribosomal protein S8 [Candidatus Odyssella thessalonicensis]|uniref:30S ribosomal protein S8 n=1 Tax=Candidatus Odyssella thessalonicensis TaxID=84647 RepID=UPI000225BC81|nr:30S ribosomal protein S8 [Candidatus Odyssella thessalonicensis]
MIVNDPIGDMLTRIRNGQRSRKSSVKSPNSKVRRAVLEVLIKEGYIRGYTTEIVRKGIENINIELKYYEGQPVIEIIERVSKPGLRVYSQSKDLASFMSGLGIHILSTPKGVMTDVEAKQQGVGGEILCRVY